MVFLETPLLAVASPGRYHCRMKRPVLALLSLLAIAALPFVASAAPGVDRPVRAKAGNTVTITKIEMPAAKRRIEVQSIRL